MTAPVDAAQPAKSSRAGVIVLMVLVLLTLAFGARTLLFPGGDGASSDDSAGERTPRAIPATTVAPTTSAPPAPSGARNPFVGRGAPSGGGAPRGAGGDPGPFGPGGQRR